MELIFIYNAHSSIGNKFFDFSHKIVSPSTYSCELCMLTHGNFGEKEEWKKFTATLNIPMFFYYIDQYEEEFEDLSEYPAVLISKGSEQKMLINKTELDKMENVSELIKTIESELVRLDQY